MTGFRVGIRIRPLSPLEKASGGWDITKVRDGCSLELLHPDKDIAFSTEEQGAEGKCRPEGFSTRPFSFDFCLSSSPCEETSSQLSVYETVGKPALSSILKGFNVCIFAYGQAGTGKSYTVTGTERDAGLLSRLCQGLFEEIEAQSGKKMFYVDVSFLELYKERAYDLLQGSRVLRLREHPRHGPFAEGLTQRRITKADDVIQLLKEARINRIKDDNEEYHKSSHMVFTLRCHQELPEEKKILVSELHLVDLAGSERLRQDESRRRKQEASLVNKSLVTLGIVISALAESSKKRPVWSEQRTENCSSHHTRSSYVPFRSSTLTWLLKETLGGNCVTCLIANISPSSTCYRDTLSTLRYAEQARNIRNCPIINELPSPWIPRTRGVSKSVRKNWGKTDKALPMNVEKEQEKTNEHPTYGSRLDCAIWKKPTEDVDFHISSLLDRGQLVTKPSSRFHSLTSLQQASCSLVLRRATTLSTYLTSSVARPQTAQLSYISPTKELDTHCVYHSATIRSGAQNKTYNENQEREQKVEKEEPLGISKSYCGVSRPWACVRRLSKSCPSLYRSNGRSFLTTAHCSPYEVQSSDIGRQQTEVSNLRAKRNTCFSVDSFEGSSQSVISLLHESEDCNIIDRNEDRGNTNPELQLSKQSPNSSLNLGSTRDCLEVSNNLLLPDRVPFILQHTSCSPEPSVFPSHLQEVKTTVWPTPTTAKAAVKKCCSTSSLDSITYVFLEHDQAAYEPVSYDIPKTVERDEVTMHLCSLSTLDSLEVEQDVARSPRTLSVDSVLLEECVRSVRAETQPLEELSTSHQQQRIPCESSGISSNSDSSSISVESGSSSATRRRDSVLVSPSFAVPNACATVQADLINLMTEVVQLLAFQQRKNKQCRCRKKCRRKVEQKGDSFDVGEIKNSNKIIKFSQDDNVRKAELQKQLLFIREERLQVRDLLAKSRSPSSSPDCLLPISWPASPMESKVGSPAAQAAVSDCHKYAAKEWKTLQTQLNDQRLPHLHDSGVDCCSSDLSNLKPEIKAPSGPITCHISEEPSSQSIERSLQPLAKIQAEKESAFKASLPSTLRAGWSSKSEAEKDRILTWIEKDLDFLERAVGPVQYKDLPDTFCRIESLFIPIPSHQRTF